MENEKPYIRRENCFFNSIAIHKIVFQSLISAVTRDIANELEKIQKTFL